jgi:DHA1 family inner membrane transport protein
MEQMLEMSAGPLKSDIRQSMNPRATILAAGTFAIGTDAFIVAGILPAIARSFASTIESTGFVVSIFSISYAIGSPIVSALTSRWPRSTVLVGGLAVFAIANLLSAVSPNLILLLFTRVLAAAAAGLVAPASYALASSLGQSHNQGKALAIVAAGFTSSMVLGVPLGVLLGDYAGWRGSLLFVAVLGGTAALAMHFVGAPESKLPQKTVSLRDQLGTSCRPETLLVIAPFLFWSIANYELYTYIAPILARHLPASSVPALLLLFGGGGMTGNFVGGALFDRYGTRWPVVIVLAVLTCSLTTMESASSSFLAAGANMAIWGLCMAALFTLQQHRTVSASPDQRGLMLAINNSTVYLGSALGAALGGEVISATSISLVAPVSAGIAFLGLLALVALRLPLPPPRSERTE